MRPTQITRLRMRLKLTQQKLAQILDVSQTSIVRWESGLNNPQGPFLLLLRALDAASSRDPLLHMGLEQMREHGLLWFWAEIFKLAHAHHTKEKA